YKAMQEVSGPIIAIALTLCAVFIPLAFISGLTGQFYRQFALTIAISTVISAFNSLTLSPAMAAKLLHAPGAKPDALERGIDKVFGGFFRVFNSFFKNASNRYAHNLGGLLQRKALGMGFYLVLIVLAGALFAVVPRGY